MVTIQLAGSSSQTEMYKKQELLILLVSLVSVFGGEFSTVFSFVKGSGGVSGYTLSESSSAEKANAASPPAQHGIYTLYVPATQYGLPPDQEHNSGLLFSSAPPAVGQAEVGQFIPPDGALLAPPSVPAAAPSPRLPPGFKRPRDRVISAGPETI